MARFMGRASRRWLAPGCAVAVAILLAACRSVSFVLPGQGGTPGDASASPRTPDHQLQRGAPRTLGQLLPRAEDPASSSRWPAAVLAAMLVSISAGAPALAQESDTASLLRIRQKALEAALANAEQKAREKEQEAAQLERAEELLKKLDSSKGVEIATEETEFKKQEDFQKKVLKDLEKKAEVPQADEKAPLAVQFFKNFFNKQQAKKAEVVQEAKKGVELRSKVIDDLDSRRANAKKAAEEAAEISARLESLAKTARETADKARQLADADVVYK
eukprot:TRINITY_DN35512_c0_g1_i1.p1 TRINITY_DN35512_c0_g1~~TRINITY_DN35512_c0_g1_i1.p1  ORF type:complete len:292 (+),score=78.64 TRINITY_DN35512_c0_g1_i1:53-877(+)